MKLAPGLHRVGSDLVNSYLVAEGNELTLIDAGVPGQWKDLTAELAGMGRSIGDIRAVILTHGDTDHIGFAQRLRRGHGVPIYVHEAGAPRARGEIKKQAGFGAGRLGPTLRFLWYAGRRGGLLVPPVADVQTFTGDATLDLPGAPRIIHPVTHRAAWRFTCRPSTRSWLGTL